MLQAVEAYIHLHLAHVKFFSDSYLDGRMLTRVYSIVHLWHLLVLRARWWRNDARFGLSTIIGSSHRVYSSITSGIARCAVCILFCFASVRFGLTVRVGSEFSQWMSCLIRNDLAVEIIQLETESCSCLKFVMRS